MGRDDSTVVWFAGDSWAISRRWCTGIRSHTVTRVSTYLYDGGNNIHGGECICPERWRHPDRWTHTETGVDNRLHRWIKSREDLWRIYANSFGISQELRKTLLLKTERYSLSKIEIVSIIVRNLVYTFPI